jgi:hypothetical protein
LHGKVFTDEARRFDVSVSSISLGVSLSDTEVERAARQLVSFRWKIVVLATFETETLRILRIIRRVMEEVGLDYSSYVFICPTISTEVCCELDPVEHANIAIPVFELALTHSQKELGRKGEGRETEKETKTER